MDGMLSARPSVVLAAASDILFLKHACMPAAFSDSDVCGSRKSQASSPWTKRQKNLNCSIETTYLQGWTWMTAWEYCRHALEKGCLCRNRRQTRIKDDVKSAKARKELPDRLAMPSKDGNPSWAGAPIHWERASQTYKKVSEGKEGRHCSFWIRGWIRAFDVPEKPDKTKDKTRFSEGNQAYKPENPDFRIKLGNSNPKIRFYPVFRSIRNTVSSKRHYPPAHPYFESFWIGGSSFISSKKATRTPSQFPHPSLSTRLTHSSPRRPVAVVTNQGLFESLEEDPKRKAARNIRCPPRYFGSLDRELHALQTSPIQPSV